MHLSFISFFICSIAFYPKLLRFFHAWTSDVLFVSQSLFSPFFIVLTLLHLKRASLLCGPIKIRKTYIDVMPQCGKTGLQCMCYIIKNVFFESAWIISWK